MIGEGCATSVLMISVCLLAMTCHLTAAAPEQDRIIQLPQLSPQPKFKQYSGYLKGKTDNIQLHYWLIESKVAPETAPLLLWLNGGPGCSSLDGLFNENGPFMIKGDGSLTDRRYSWNQFGNLLYLETPAGTGFSYAKDDVISTSDDQSADENYHALEDFLAKFPEYHGRDLYILGEGFGGVYAAHLTKRLVDKPVGLRHRGMAIGNGLTNNEFNDNSLLYFARYHGIIDEKMWTNVTQECCADQPPYKCMFSNGIQNEKCSHQLIQIRTKQGRGLDYYNIYRSCEGGVQSEPSGNQGRSLTEQLNSYGPETCLSYAALETYLNQEDVKAALHITKPGINWKVCNKILPRYTRQYKDQKEVVLKVLSGNVHVLLYNGDVDAICNFIGGEWFAESLDLQQTSPYSKWLYNDELGKKQVGGWRKIYTSGGRRVIFSTVKGSGHTVPRDTPASAYHMISNFIATANF